MTWDEESERVYDIIDKTFKNSKYGKYSIEVAAEETGGGIYTINM